MDSKEIGLIAAMPEETAPLLKRFPPAQSRRMAAFQYHRLSCQGRIVHLIQSGMGPANAEAATRTLLDLTHPTLLLNIGFTGAVRPGPQVGDLIVARQVLRFERGILAPADGLSSEATEQVTTLLNRGASNRKWRCLGGTFITASQFLAKSEMSSLLPREVENPALEMESSAIGSVAASAGIPYAAIRTVSDAAEEELGFSIDEITDDNLNVVPMKAAILILKRPRLIPQLCRLARNSKLAGHNLAEAVTIVLESIDE